MAFCNLIRTVVDTACSDLPRGLKIKVRSIPTCLHGLQYDTRDRSRYSSVVNTADRRDTMTAASGADVWGNWRGSSGAAETRSWQNAYYKLKHFMLRAQQTVSYKDIQYKITIFLTFIISIKDGHCDYSPRAPRRCCCAPVL